MPENFVYRRRTYMVVMTVEMDTKSPEDGENQLKEMFKKMNEDAKRKYPGMQIINEGIQLVH